MGQDLDSVLELVHRQDKVEVAVSMELPYLGRGRYLGLVFLVVTWMGR